MEGDEEVADPAIGMKKGGVKPSEKITLSLTSLK